jgi:hypothetical protein
MSELLNPFRALADAAIGDIEAQRALADEAVRLAGEDDGDPGTVLREGLIFARMAAVYGHSGDKGRVIAMLELARALAQQEGDHRCRDLFEGEAIARIALLAEEGVEVASNTLGRMVELSSPAAMSIAKDYDRSLRALEPVRSPADQAAGGNAFSPERDDDEAMDPMRPK